MNGIVLSSFTVAEPVRDTDFQPILQYYVQTGDYAAGTVIDFTQSHVSAALCDFTNGHTVFDVTLNLSGSWIVQAVQ